MTKKNKEEKYLEDKLALIRASVGGMIAGVMMFPPEDGQYPAEYIDKMFSETIEKDVRNIANYFKRLNQ